MLSRASLVALVGSRDLTVADAFYGGILGLSKTESTGFANVYDGGGSKLRVTRVPEVVAAPYTVVGWSVGDIEGLVGWLRDRGVVFNRYPGVEQDALDTWTAPSGARVAWFNDPDGNTLSLTQLPPS